MKKLFKRIGISIVEIGLLGVSSRLVWEIAAAQSIGECFSLFFVISLLGVAGVLLIQLW